MYLKTNLRVCGLDETVSEQLSGGLTLGAGTQGFLKSGVLFAKEATVNSSNTTLLSGVNELN